MSSQPGSMDMIDVSFVKIEDESEQSSISCPESPETESASNHELNFTDVQGDFEPKVGPCLIYLLFT